MYSSPGAPCVGEKQGTIRSPLLQRNQGYDQPKPNPNRASRVRIECRQKTTLNRNKVAWAQKRNGGASDHTPPAARVDRLNTTDTLEPLEIKSNQPRRNLRLERAWTSDEANQTHDPSCRPNKTPPNFALLLLAVLLLSPALDRFGRCGSRDRRPRNSDSRPSISTPRSRGPGLACGRSRSSGRGLRSSARRRGSAPGSAVGSCRVSWGGWLSSPRARDGGTGAGLGAEFRPSARGLFCLDRRDGFPHLLRVIKPTRGKGGVLVQGGGG